MRPVALALLLVALLGGSARAFTARDMLGRDVTLAAPPSRIVSLVPSVTEILFALGADDRLVGVTSFCDYPAAARRKPRVGDMINPSLEAIVALRPELVVATTEGNREETVAQLERLGIPTYLVAVHHLGDVTALISRLGALTGRGAAAASLVSGLERRIDAVRRVTAPLARPRVLYVVWPEPLVVPGRDALVTELIGLAGGESISAGVADAYPRYSLEAAVAGAPEVILLANHGAGVGPVDRERWEQLTTLPAVKAGRLRRVDGDLLHRYGPRLADGVEQLARAIHPEAFR